MSLETQPQTKATTSTPTGPGQVPGPGPLKYSTITKNGHVAATTSGQTQTQRPNSNQKLNTANNANSDYPISASLSASVSSNSNSNSISKSKENQVLNANNVNKSNNGEIKAKGEKFSTYTRNHYSTGKNTSNQIQHQLQGMNDSLSHSRDAFVVVEGEMENNEIETENIFDTILKPSTGGRGVGSGIGPGTGTLSGTNSERVIVPLKQYSDDDINLEQLATPQLRVSDIKAFPDVQPMENDDHNDSRGSYRKPIESISRSSRSPNNTQTVSESHSQSPHTQIHTQRASMIAFSGTGSSSSNIASTAVGGAVGQNRYQHLSAANKLSDNTISSGTSSSINMHPAVGLGSAFGPGNANNGVIGIGSPRRHSTVYFVPQGQRESQQQLGYQREQRPRIGSDSDFAIERDATLHQIQEQVDSSVEKELDDMQFNSLLEYKKSSMLNQGQNQNPANLGINESTVFACPPGFTRTRHNPNSRSYGSAHGIVGNANNRLEPIEEHEDGNIELNKPLNRRRVTLGANESDLEFAERVGSNLGGDLFRSNRAGSGDFLLESDSLAWKNIRHDGYMNTNAQQLPSAQDKQLMRMPSNAANARSESMQFPDSLLNYRDPRRELGMGQNWNGTAGAVNLGILSEEETYALQSKYGNRRHSTPPRHLDVTALGQFSNLGGPGLGIGNHMPKLNQPIGQINRLDRYSSHATPPSPHGSALSHSRPSLRSQSPGIIQDPVQQHLGGYGSTMDPMMRQFGSLGISQAQHTQGMGLNQREFMDPSYSLNPREFVPTRNQFDQYDLPEMYPNRPYHGLQTQGHLALHPQHHDMLNFGAGQIDGGNSRNWAGPGPYGVSGPPPDFLGLGGGPQFLNQYPSQHSQVAAGLSPRNRNMGQGMKPRGMKQQRPPGNEQMCESLQEYRATGKRPTMDALMGNVVEYSKDSHGSRFIQFKMETASDLEKKMLIEEILTEAVNLAAHPFGNYVIQNFLLHASGEQRFALAAAFKGHMVRLSTQAHGCRVVQYAFDIVSLPQRNVLMKEIVQNIYVVSKNNHGTHVVQKCMGFLLNETLEMEAEQREKLNAECTKHGAPTSLELLHSVEKAVVADMLKLAIHPHSYRLVQQTLANCDPNRSPSIAEILKLVERNYYALAVDQHGNFILQHILDNGSVEQVDNVQKFVCNHSLELAQHKFGSHLVEKCLTSATRAQSSAIIHQFLTPTGVNAAYFKKQVTSNRDYEAAESEDGDNASALLMLSKDPYANFVVQRAFDQSTGDERALIAQEIRKRSDILSRYTYGRHILSHINRTEN